LRRLAAAILAVPVIASIYLATLMAAPGARRYLAASCAALLVGIVGIGLVLPPPASSVPPSTPRPVAGDQLQPVATSLGIAAARDPSANASAAVAVAAPIKAGSGAERPAPVTVMVPESAPTAAPTGAVSASVAVRTPTTARISGSLLSGKRIQPATAIVVRFDRPVTLKAVRAALTIKPAVKGTVRAVGNKVFMFTPARPLAANTAYTIGFSRAITDAAGVAIALPAPVHLLTATAPRVVRFRPTKGTTDVDPTSLVSVRFTKPMNHRTTERAFGVVVAGRRLAGSISWAENDTVLVFKPAKVLAKGAGVGVRVLGTATSADGVPLSKGGSATFKTVAPPQPRPTAAKPATKPVVRPGGARPAVPRSGGGAVGGGSWAAAEAYYLELMNCTRTGGYLTSSGSCSSPGGRDVAPLWIDAGISANVSRPYAKYLATTGICSHFADGNPGTRLRRAGYNSYRWAENISCPKSMGVMALMVYTQQYFQAEKSYNGGHYVNLMNPLYDRVGIGVWVTNGVAEIVIDFYRP
jgi:uncharacterized protein YkwD